MNRLVDTHLHTDNSPDGTHTAMYLCEQAELMGVRSICITDHCECDSYEKYDYARRVRNSFFEATKAKQSFEGEVLVLRGIELGQPHYMSEIAEKIISTYEYDEIIGSIHNLRNQKDFGLFENFTQKEAEELFDEYLNEEMNLIHFGNFDILAHLTYPMRYFYSKSNIDIDLNKFKEKVDRILFSLVKNDKALEVNTGGLRQPLKKLSPEFPVISRFRELGGKYITFGSDAHRAEDICFGFTDVISAIRAAGFSEITIFEHRTPLTLPIF
ncbi:MAG: histidinol-phosphatase HisJ family protein [Candidatus Fimenecus sp.]